MHTEDSFIRSYCEIAGVSEIAAPSAYILSDALHPREAAAGFTTPGRPRSRTHTSPAAAQSGIRAIPRRSA